MTLRAFWISAGITIVMMMMAMVTGTLSNDDDDGSENVAKNMNLRSNQTESHLFGPAQYVKCRRLFLELNWNLNGLVFKCSYG